MNKTTPSLGLLPFFWAQWRYKLNMANTKRTTPLIAVGIDTALPKTTKQGVNEHE
jgi:hypothetical protein